MKKHLGELECWGSGRTNCIALIAQHSGKSGDGNVKIESLVDFSRLLQTHVDVSGVALTRLAPAWAETSYRTLLAEAISYGS